MVWGGKQLPPTLETGRKIRRDRLGPFRGDSYLRPSKPGAAGSSPREPDSPAPHPGGSPNYYMDIPHPVAFGDLAVLAVRTLQDVYEVPNPTALAYKAGTPDGTV